MNEYYRHWIERKRVKQTYKWTNKKKCASNENNETFSRVLILFRLSFQFTHSKSSMVAIQFLLTGCVARFTSFDSIRTSHLSMANTDAKGNRKTTKLTRNTKMDFVLYKIQIETNYRHSDVHMHQISMLNSKIECENVFNGEYVSNVCVFVPFWFFFSCVGVKRNNFTFCNRFNIERDFHSSTHTHADCSILEWPPPKNELNV